MFQVSPNESLYVKLDYWGSLSAGLPLVRLGKLQIVLRLASRVNAGITRRDHSSDYMFYIGSLTLSRLSCVR